MPDGLQYWCKDCMGNFIFVEPKHDAKEVTRRLEEEKKVQPTSEPNPTGDEQVNTSDLEDENGKMNVNPHDANAEMLIISQFTLFADCKSRRPGFSKAARPEKAIPLYELVIAKCRESGFRVETGVFAAEMLVDSQNDGPVTILLDTKEL